MSSSVTKYLLIVPSAYVLYCIYEDYQYQANKIALEKAQESESIKSLTNRFTACKSSIEMANVFKKSFHYLRGSIIQPTRIREEVVDCEVLESGQGSSWWLYPYSTRSKMSLTPYQTIESRKEGHYSIFFWYHVLTKQTLQLQDTRSEVQAITKMINHREKKCAEIAKKHDHTAGPDFEDHFFNCIRRSEAAVRMIEKELNRIQLIQEQSIDH